MKLASLQVVRAIAAMVVVAGHAPKLLDGFLAQVPHVVRLSNLATEAVIVFFVLSGAVITLSQQARQRTAAIYLADRALRLYPIYLLALGLGCLAAVLANRSVPTGLELAGHLLFLQSLQGWIVQVIGANDPLWTLAYEMWFYVAFAAVVAAPRSRRMWIVIGLAGAALTYVLPSTAPGILLHASSVAAFSLFWLLGHAAVVLRGRVAPGPASGLAMLAAGFLWSRAWTGITGNFFDFLRWGGFALGAALFIASLLARAEAPDPRWTRWSRLSCVLSAVLMWQFASSDLAAKSVMAAAAAMALVVSDAMLARAGSTLRWGLGPLVWVGGISYGIYAVHFPIFILANHALSSLGVGARLGVALIATLLVAWLAETLLAPKQFARRGPPMPVTEAP